MTFRTTLIKHEQVLLAQSQQSAACNATHTIEARLSRWLLRCRDLIGSMKGKIQIHGDILSTGIEWDAQS